MSKSPHLTVAEQLPRQVVRLDILKQQMLDLEVLCKEVAEAEKRSRRHEHRNCRRERPSSAGVAQIE